MKSECDKMQSGICQSLHSRIGPGKSLQAYDGMSFASLASLVDSCNVYRPASMTVRWDGLALFRQELGLSSDSKIQLIYGISTLVFPLDLLSPLL